MVSLVSTQVTMQCRAKGESCDLHCGPYNQWLAYCTWMSRSRRPATVLTDGPPERYGAPGADGLGFFALSLAAYAAHRTPANGAWRCPVPPARAPAALLVQTACDPARAPSASRDACGRGVDAGARLHTARQRATGLEERHELALGLRVLLDVALRHGEAGMARELLHVPETPPDLRHSARRTRNEGAAPGMR